MMAEFRLRSAVGERGKWSGGGEAHTANRSRNASRRPFCTHSANAQLVTSVAIAKWNWCGRQGHRGAAPSTRGAPQSRELVTAVKWPVHWLNKLLDLAPECRV